MASGDTAWSANQLNRRTRRGSEPHQLTAGIIRGGAPYFILSILVVILFSYLIIFDSISQTLTDSEISGVKPEKVTPVIKEGECIKTGKDFGYYEKATTYIEGGETRTDECINSNILIEYYCSNYPETKIKSDRYDCPYGCKDGVCIEEPDVQTETLILTEIKDIVLTPEKFDDVTVKVIGFIKQYGEFIGPNGEKMIASCGGCFALTSEDYPEEYVKISVKNKTIEYVEVWHAPANYWAEIEGGIKNNDRIEVVGTLETSPPAPLTLHLIKIKKVT